MRIPLILKITAFLRRRREWKERVEWSTGLKTEDWLIKGNKKD
ncbi:unnamed protein product [marine sediment metagenome]|uniref:Uncharacterized protein n=1 Tax=marine sediment metagenome TaxID=412755 RepID=X1LG80_9ZZZZ